MELDVSVDGRSLAVDIEDPFRLDIDDIMGHIDGFIRDSGLDLNGIDIAGLLPLMVKGIAGCEDGCPADAKSLVSRGYKEFAIEYIEGGILSASTEIVDGKVLELKMFPEF
ncbi:MAG: hypothetical protein JSV21_01540 [Nitrospirota bacterium]|nr:MAG: hypothetical protein JSV21_01540 [Nitrospirota bacterium]